MLKLLLSERISPHVAADLRRRVRSVPVQSMAEWEGGNFMAREEAACLKEAARQRLTFVTYDRLTIPPLLKAWADEECASGECSHGGFIFIDEKNIPPATRLAWCWLWPGWRKRRRAGTGRIVCFFCADGFLLFLLRGDRGIPHPARRTAPDMGYPIFTFHNNSVTRR